ncbi:MAG: hypothetical protein AAFY07_11050 [Pseudomonadota bacterium]
MKHHNAHRLRVCFYIPVTTSWWFTEIISNLIRTLASEHEVHAIVTPEWKGTGLNGSHMRLLEELNNVQWHIFNHPDHHQLRTDASGTGEVINFIRQINPDLTLCRSADIKTPAQFPGHVRYIMEGGAEPMIIGPRSVVLSPNLFDHGILPELSSDQDQRLDDLANVIFDTALNMPKLPPRSEVFEAAGLSPCAKTLVLPLEYQHEENFFRQHLDIEDNAQLITQVVSRLPQDTQLLVTDHPLNVLHCDTSEVEKTLASLKGKAGMLREIDILAPPTLAAIHYSDAMVVQNSKSWTLCADLDKPLLRLSDFATADWVNAYCDWPDFLNDLAHGELKRPDAVMARRWFAFRAANDVFSPHRPGIHRF